MLTSIFILVVNNGESYSDENHWNEGIFNTLENAKSFAIANKYKDHLHPYSYSTHYEVEEWNIQGKVTIYEFDF